MSKTKKILGIDLGTTYSCVAYINDYGQPEVIPNAEGERTTPSVVWFDGKRAVVGQEAKEMSNIYPNNVCSFVKRNMGNEEFTFDVDCVQYTPEHVSSLILRKLVKDASEHLGEEVKDVVITCPAYFFVKEREATKRAGEIAGLNVLRIINEPTAAAFAYGVKPND
ncbi:MAG: Hsp70 family protein, partial [Planctomycetaceae bacterium]|nr:Hsp70 family protein [Planctomycetaceae bacterium]